MAAAERASYRFAVLLFNCLLTFGSYFCFDIPSILQQQFQGNLTCPNGIHRNSTRHNGTLECVEGLGMAPAQYNLLYTIYAWINAVVVILARFLIDKLGNHFGVFVFSLLTALGSSIFALGSRYNGSPYLLPVMLTGRLLFGSGNGSVLNFFFSQQFETEFGMQWTFWGAIQDIQHLPLHYWLLVLTIMFFYNRVFPFVADARTTLDCAMLTLPVFALLAFTSVPPLVSTIWLGITYSFVAYVVIYTVCGPPSVFRDNDGAGNFCTDDWGWPFKSDCWTHSGNKVQDGMLDRSTTGAPVGQDRDPADAAP